MQNPLVLILKGLVRGYQLFLSPLKPPCCRFQPSCSAYALGALSKHGAFKGCWLALKRIARCHPWNEGGYDPVPEPKSKAVAGQSKCCQRHAD